MDIEDAGSVEKHSVEEGLQVCPDCETDFVIPMQVVAEDGGWNLDRECMNCGWKNKRWFTQAEINRYDGILDQQTKVIAMEDHANMEADVDQLIEALRADHIQPIDF